MLIDFGVKDTKDYSFFLDEELFELHINKTDEGYHYDLRHNQEAETPHNIRLRETTRQDNRRLWAAAVVAVLIMALFGGVFYRNFHQRKLASTALYQEGGQLTQVSVYQRSGRWWASYRVADKVEEVEIAWENSTYSPLGFPLQDGDRFAGQYDERFTDLIRVEWDKPQPDVLQRYVQQAYAKHSSLHPELSEQQHRCQLRVALELKGVKGLALFHQQKALDFPVYNRNAYYRFVRDEAFRDAAADCL